MNKILCFMCLLLITILVWRCTAPKDLEMILLEEMKENNLSQKDLVLVISENMCSTCVQQELKNIEQIKDGVLVIVGIYRNMRQFKACISTISNCIPFFINSSERKIEITNSPFYFLYHPNDQSCLNKFYPQQHNDITSTLDFLRKHHAIE